MDYCVKGYFYMLPYAPSSVKARSVLTITNHKLERDKRETYDLLVVMMNPGGSLPKKSVQWNDKPIRTMNNLVEAVPDDTQYQIMKVMDKTGYNNALILNISDVCETNSNTFVKNVNACDYGENGLEHSIFSDARSKELSMILSHFSGATAILASGVNYKLRFLTRQMLSKIECSNLISKKHENEQFYHPLPRGGQAAWVSYIVNKLNS